MHCALILLLANHIGDGESAAQSMRRGTGVRRARFLTAPRAARALAASVSGVAGSGISMIASVPPPSRWPELQSVPRVLERIQSSRMLAMPASLGPGTKPTPVSRNRQAQVSCGR
jgi:hypothetical protein